MRCLELSPPQSAPVLPSAAETAVPARSRLQRCRDVLKVLLRTSNEIRRLLRDAAAEIGEIVGGDLGREVGRLGASFLLGLMSDTLLNDPAGQSASEQLSGLS